MKMSTNKNDLSEKKKKKKTKKQKGSVREKAQHTMLQTSI